MLADDVHLMFKVCKTTLTIWQAGPRGPSLDSMQINLSFLGCILDRQKAIMFNIN